MSRQYSLFAESGERLHPVSLGDEMPAVGSVIGPFVRLPDSGLHNGALITARAGRKVGQAQVIGLDENGNFEGVIVEEGE
jgi:hypothetical protein